MNLDKKKLIIYIVLTIVTFAVFGQTNQFDFINLDDYADIKENSHIQSGITLAELRWMFSRQSAELWNPLVKLSFMFDYQLYGLNAGGYHLTNLILHILCTLLLFWLFNRMTGAIWKSAFVAACFALHPLHVESVAWIAERKDVLSAFFWTLTLCLYVYYTEKPVIKRYLFVLFFFVLALMSKPMVVTLPVIMILLDYWPLRRFESKKNNWFLWQLKEKTLFFILSIVLVFITLNAPYNPDSTQLPLHWRIANAPVSFVTYLEKTFWPHDLVAFYPFAALSAWHVLLAVLLIISISTAVIMMAKHFPSLFVGWFWYTITLVPVIKIVQVGCDAMADRYTYLPSIGIAVMLAWGVPLLFPRENIRKHILFPAGIAVITILSVLSWHQCGYWRNSIDLWSHALRVSKYNYVAYYLRGNAYGEQGQYQRAIEEFNKAIFLKQDFADAYNQRGLAYLSQGDRKQSCIDAQKACRLGNCLLLDMAKVKEYCK
jgi:hypothetical protein